MLELTVRKYVLSILKCLLNILANSTFATSDVYFYQMNKDIIIIIISIIITIIIINEYNNIFNN